jgi:predicted phage tail protein
MEKSLFHRVVGGSKGGGKGGGGSSRVAQEAPNTLQSKSVLRVVELISEGEILGLVDGAKSIYLDDTPLQNSDGSFNFSGISFEERKGTPSQTHLAGFPAVEAEVAVGVEVTQPTPLVRTITDADTDAVMVTMRVPSLTEQNTSNGDLNGSKVQYTIEYKPSGGSYITAIDSTKGTIQGKTTSPYERQHRVNLTGSAPWDIRVTRVTPDNNVANIQNDLFWSSYTRIIDNKLTYPDWALVGLSVDSSLFGSSIPQRAFEVRGLKIKIPVNYNPTTRVYTGIWNGTFTTAWTDNPAWILYDLLTNNRYGLGNYIDVAEVDKYALYTIGQYCDELVPNGKGGTEPRFTFNGVISSQEDALKVLQAVASSFRGMLYWGASGTSGVITAVQDAPSDPAKLFTPANVIDGIFTYSGAPLESVHAACYVTWNNPAEAYAPAIEVVESPLLPTMNTYRKLDVVAYGCSSQGQANRLGKWILDTEIYGSEIVVFKAGLADADTRPGMIVKIQDPAYADIRYGGRVMSATTTQVTLDAPVELVSGQTYTLDVVLPDGTIASKAVTNTPGTYSVLNLVSALAQTPDPMTLWAITSTNLAPRQFRVLAVKENSDIEYEVTALLHDPTKYARVENNINIPTTSFSRIGKGAIPAPTNLTFSEYLFNTGPFLRSAVNLSWEAAPDSRVVKYEVEGKTPGTGNNYELLKITNGLAHVVEGTVDGTWSFRVRALDALGNFSPWTELANQTLTINGTAPGNVQDFQITNLTNTSVLSWAPVTNRNLSHYEIRYSSALTLANWNAAVQVIDKVSKDTTSVVVASRTGTFMIKAVTLATEQYPQGVYSNDASMVSTDIDFLSTFNFVEDLQEDTAFLGYKDKTQLSAGNLELTEASPGVFEAEGSYIHSRIIDLGATYTSRVTPNITVAGNLATNDVDLWADVDAILNVDGVTDGLWAVETQVSYTQLDPFIPAANILTAPSDFSNAAWTKTAITLTPNAIAAPDGSVTADTVSPSNATSVIFQNTTVAGNDNAFTLRCKAGTGRYLTMRTVLFDTNLTVGFDLLLGTCQAGGVITPLGDGWYECSLLQTLTGSDLIGQIAFYFATALGGTTGAVGSTWHIWAATCSPGTAPYNPWSVYRPLDVGDINARALRFLTKLWSYFPSVTPSIEALSVTIDMTDLLQSGENLVSNASANTVVTFPYTFRSPRPAVVITPQSMATGDYYVVTNITAAGFTINFYNSSGTRISRSFDYHTKGYGILN